MRNRRSRAQRIAIDKAEIRRRCSPLKFIMEGARAHRTGLPRDANPYEGKNQQAWSHGWDLTEDKKNA